MKAPTQAKPTRQFKSTDFKKQYGEKFVETYLKKRDAAILRERAKKKELPHTEGHRF